MAKVEFDNKKMWESVLSYTHCHKEITKDHLLYALNDQGFEYKDGEIVCIEPKGKETIKAGNWFNVLRICYWCLLFIYGFILAIVFPKLSFKDFILPLIIFLCAMGAGYVDRMIDEEKDK